MLPIEPAFAAQHGLLNVEKMNYVPNSAKVLNHTKLMKPGTSETFYFVAPTKPGTYTYVCTFPGHFTVIQGTQKLE